MSSLFTSNFLLLLLFGYLIGSISPGYFFGRLVRGIDIRKYEPNKNTGATNTYYVVGPAYGIFTGIFDSLKAISVYFLAVSGFFGTISGLNPELAILVGLTAVVGHISPFYLGFRGGRGAASLLGLNIIALFFTQSYYALMLFAGSIVYAFLIVQRPEVKEMLREAPLRRFLKLTGLFLPLGYLATSRGFFVRVLSVLLIVSVVFDLLRFLFPKFDEKYLRLKILAKQKESKTLSGYSLFLLSAYLLFLFFPKEIVVLSLTFFILGDVFAPFIGSWFLPLKIIGEKTVGGFTTILILSLAIGNFLKSLTSLPITLEMILAGAFLTALLDQLSVFIDDNLLVPLGTAAILTLLI